VRGPDEPGGDDRVAFVVDAQSAVVDEPGPGAFDDPTPGKDLEAVRFGAGDDLGVDA
jgi:hypothetical protein